MNLSDHYTTLDLRRLDEARLGRELEHRRLRAERVAEIADAADGVTDAVNEAGEDFGEDRLISIVSGRTSGLAGNSGTARVILDRALDDDWTDAFSHG